MSVSNPAASNNVPFNVPGDGTARDPQLVLRIGRGPVVPHAPRRPLADVLA